MLHIYFSKHDIKLAYRAFNEAKQEYYRQHTHESFVFKVKLHEYDVTLTKPIAKGDSDA